jgi:hypothetical protein
VSDVNNNNKQKIKALEENYSIMLNRGRGGPREK